MEKGAKVLAYMLVVALVLGEKIIQLFKKKGKISLYLSFIVGIVILFLVTRFITFNLILRRSILFLTLALVLFYNGLNRLRLCKI